VTVLAHMRELSMRTSDAGALLGMFSLPGDIARQTRAPCPAARRQAFALAPLVAGRHNLLLLDEPTQPHPPSRVGVPRAGSVAGDDDQSSVTTRVRRSLQPSRVIFMPEDASITGTRSCSTLVFDG